MVVQKNCWLVGCNFTGGLSFCGGSMGVNSVG